MPIKLANNASTRLAAPLDALATTITVESGGGDKFPILGAGDYFPVTVVAADGQLEILRCTARSGDTFTVERAQEGTTAKEFSAGSTVELRFTAGAVDDILQMLEDRIDTVEGYKVGDYLTTVRDPGSNWLKRDGQLYDKLDYPDLSAIMPPLPDGFVTAEKPLPTLPYSSAGLIDHVGDKYVFFNWLPTDSAPKFVMCSSVDGNTFTQESGVYDGLPQSFAHGNGKMMLTDYKYGRSPIWHSIDGGVTWTMTANLNGTKAIGACGYFPDIDTFFIGGQDGFARKSQNLTSWTAASVGLGTGWIESFYYADGCLLCWVSSNIASPLSWTANGTTWNQPTLGLGAAARSIVYGAGTWVVVGGNGKISTSTDLTNWFQRTSGVTSNIIKVIYTGAFFVAFTSDALLISDDGEDWLKWDIPAGIQAINDITADVNNPVKIIAVSKAGNCIYNFTRTSPDQFAVPDDNPINGFIKAL